MIHTFANWLFHVFGMYSVDNPYYLFWSGVGGDFAIIGLVAGGFKAVSSVKKHLNRHQEQLKRHIDYKLDRQTEQLDD